MGREKGGWKKEGETGKRKKYKEKESNKKERRMEGSQGVGKEPGVFLSEVPDKKMD